MPNYRRAFSPGGTFFFTLVTYRRAPFLCDEPPLSILRRAINECRQRRPFRIDAFVILPDHIHAIWTLPDGDPDFSTRWARIKLNFTREFLASGGHERPISPSRRHNRRRGVWQRRFWEHLIRDPDDFNRHLNYIHYNPVKHKLANCPHAWPYSSFNRWVERETYAPDWSCACAGRTPEAMNWRALDLTAME